MTDETWLTEYFVNLPAKVYTVKGISGSTSSRSSTTRRSSACWWKRRPSAPRAPRRARASVDTGYGYWKNDVRGAVTYAINRMLHDKDVKVTHLMFNFMEMVGGQESSSPT